MCSLQKSAQNKCCHHKIRAKFIQHPTPHHTTRKKMPLLAGFNGEFYTFNCCGCATDLYSRVSIKKGVHADWKRWTHTTTTTTENRYYHQVISDNWTRYTQQEWQKEIHRCARPTDYKTERGTAVRECARRDYCKKDTGLTSDWTK